MKEIYLKLKDNLKQANLIKASSGGKRRHMTFSAMIAMVKDFEKPAVTPRVMWTSNVQRNPSSPREQGGMRRWNPGNQGNPGNRGKTTVFIIIRH